MATQRAGVNGPIDTDSLIQGGKRLDGRSFEEFRQACQSSLNLNTHCIALWSIQGNAGGGEGNARSLDQALQPQTSPVGRLLLQSQLKELTRNVYTRGTCSDCHKTIQLHSHLEGPKTGSQEGNVYMEW